MLKVEPPVHSGQGRYWDALASGGDRTALIEARSGRSLSYAELADRCEALGDAVYRKSERGLIFLTAQHTIQFVVHLLAAWRCGQAVMIVNQGLPKNRMQRLVERYRPQHLVLASDDGAALPSRYRAEGSRAYEQPLHGDLALLLSTSGSTGSPKAVRLSYDNLAANAAQITAALRLDGDTRSLLNLPLSYTYGLSVLTSSLACHASVVLREGSFIDPHTWQAIREHRCTAVHGVSASYESIRSACGAGLSLPALSAFAHSGGRLDEATLHWIRESLLPGSGADFYRMYGLTEATARACVLPPEEFADKPGSVGRPVPGARVEISEDGEIVFSGPNVMMGYAAERQDLALGDVLEGRLLTNDLGRVDENSCLYVLGRLDRTCKINGVRVSLDELQAEFLIGLPVVLAASDSRLTLYHEGGVDVGTIGDRLDAVAGALGLPSKMIASREVVRIPRLANGKIDYSSLPLAAPGQENAASM